VRYEILGPLRIVRADGVSMVRPGRAEVVLAVLLIRAHQTVPTAQLVREVWDTNPPRRATAALHVYISQLRKLLRPTNPILTRSPGYVLRLGADEVDFHAFLRMANEGRGRFRRGDYDAAAAELSRALSLWRGPVLGGQPAGPTVRGLGSWLAEARLECTERLMDARLRLGRHREVIDELYALIAEYPLREAFHGQLMLALYRAQRRAEALLVYRQARRTFRGDLGQEPGRALRRLHASILAAKAG
jgi:DNA-binding SARP family transcriptional activator